MEEDYVPKASTVLFLLALAGAISDLRRRNPDVGERLLNDLEIHVTHIAPLETTSDEASGWGLLALHQRALRGVEGYTTHFQQLSPEDFERGRLERAATVDLLNVMRQQDMPDSESS